MILANGIVYETDAQNELLSGLPEKLNKTLNAKPLDSEIVINAFDNLGQRIAQGEFSDLISSIEMSGKDEYIDLAVRMMSRKYLEYKLKVELGDSKTDLFKDNRITCGRVPLGVLFHIAAGNMDALPVVSIAEGLLAGNINILKLPSVDNGLTVKAMEILIEFEPRLKDYIYIFDTPSSDVVAMKKMADMADGIVVWGGDEAVAAVRSLAKPGTRLIEWGHKLGFMYISGFENKEQELKDLAEHIMVTKQLLCSSCQVIYINTESFDEVKEFAKEFVDYLNAAAAKYPVDEIGAIAEISIKRRVALYDELIGGDLSSKDEAVFYGDNISVTASPDSELELSYMFGNVYVKPLPRRDIMSVLRAKKEYLQTAGLICSPELRDELAAEILRTGVERVTRAGNMSFYFDGESHDGEFPLLRYTRIINIEK
ncbi:MAG: acyl-CoA reductase [Saccharofermentans sp.]|nr:acyl-CoA reductase [Saccharofermentans sp.]